MRKKELSASVLSILLLLVPVPPCGGSTRSLPAIRLGCSLSLSGSLSHSGNLYKKAYDLAVEKINENGGVKIDGQPHRFEIIYGDDKSEPEEAARLCQRMITREKVDFLLGPYSSEIVLAVSDVAEKHGITMIQGSAANARVFDRGYRYVFGTLPRAGDYFRGIMEMIAHHSPKDSGIALVFANDKFDRLVAEGCLSMAAEMSIKIILSEEYIVGRRDFSDIIDRIRSEEAKNILFAGNRGEAMNFVRQIVTDGLATELICLSSGLKDKNLAKELGRQAEHLFGVSFWHEGLNYRGEVFGDCDNFTRLFREKYKENPDYHAAAAAVCLVVFKEAIEKAGSLEPEKVREAMADIDLQTIYGRIDFKPDGQIRSGTAVLQIIDGRPWRVYPEGDRKPFYPW